jgi:hypothetical protein
MKRKLAALGAAAVVALLGASACGGVQDRIERRAQEEVDQGRQRIEKEVEKGQKQVEEEMDRQRTQIEKEVERVKEEQQNAGEGR